MSDKDPFQRLGDEEPVGEDCNGEPLGAGADQFPNGQSHGDQKRGIGHMEKRPRRKGDETVDETDSRPSQVSPDQDSADQEFSDQEFSDQEFSDQEFSDQEFSDLDLTARDSCTRGSSSSRSSSRGSTSHGSTDANHITAPRRDTAQRLTQSINENDELELDDLDELTQGVSESESNSIGRYRIESRIGYGGFGSVYLATDTDLHRRVAIKIPHPSRVEREKDIERFLAEARTVAALDYPGIVPIYEFGRFKDRCYVVSKYIEGGTLASRISESVLTFRESITILRRVAEVLGFVHAAGIVHRDVKPGNLLLDSSGVCYLTDFGLALHDTNDIRNQGRIGTYVYMSPEQARGESHLVDRRSDLFSLGVVMYELICDALPFVGHDFEEILASICDKDPKPPRKRNSKIPREVERVCLKLLSKRASARYQTAAELIEDLDCILSVELPSAEGVPSARGLVAHSSSQSTSEMVGIVPRGLRSFDEEDALSFRTLLPGSRDRDGVPDRLQFWRRRIDSSGPTEAFRVGVLYGSSGSGKSSFVKAGLIPILGSHVTTVFVEASGTETEERLLGALRTACEALPRELNLAASMAWVRKHQENAGADKILVVIDQFEQWLHVHSDDSGEPLIAALRQCDGPNLQSLLLVRDDYWMGLSRLAEELEIDLVRSRNMAMVDLFDRRHARIVLVEYGRGYEQLPQDIGEMDDDQSAFLDAAIDGLAEDGKIVPVQLVTFAEIMKSRPWRMKSLQDVGGTDGVGVRFLDESLGASAPVDNRVHFEAAQAVLSALLPEAGSQIKGAMRSESQLRSIAGYAHSPRKFEQLIAILDNELRLITPTDSAGAVGEDQQASRNYQLTHDFLVPAIRTWLERNQRLTIRGRAAMRLVDRSNIWNARRDPSHLPSWTEWLGYLLLTHGEQYNDAQRRLMSTANYRHGIRTALYSVALVAIAWFGSQSAMKSKAKSLVHQLETASVLQAGSVLDELDGYRTWSAEPLEQLAATTDIRQSGGLLSRLALLRLDPKREALIDELYAELLRADVSRLSIIVDELSRSERLPVIVERLWGHGDSWGTNARQRVNAGLALASLDPEGPQWSQVADQFLADLIMQVIRRPPDYPHTVTGLHAVADQLNDGLHQIFRESSDPQRRQQAANYIIDLNGGDVDSITEAFLVSDQTHYDFFLPHLNRLPRQELVKKLDEAIVVGPSVHDNVNTRMRLSKRQVNAAALKLNFGKPAGCWELLGRRVLPGVRSRLIEQATWKEVDPQMLLDQFERSDDPSVQSALLLMLGSFDPERMPSLQVAAMVDQAKRSFEFSPDASIHAASHWLLLRQGFSIDRWLDNTKAKLAATSQGSEFGWTIDPTGQAFVRFPREGYTLEVASHEVTMEQYLNDPGGRKFPSEMRARLHHPVGLTDWFHAIHYCRWLTKQQGMDEDDQCHPMTEAELRQIGLHPNYLSKKGFRLLTPDEWRSVCMEDSRSRFAMGDDTTLFDNYGFADGDKRITHPVMSMKPLPSGLFGMYGNVTEWCSEVSLDVEERPTMGAKNRESAEDRMSRGVEIGGYPAKTHFYSVGFRVCRVVPNTQDEGNREAIGQ